MPLRSMLRPWIGWAVIALSPVQNTAAWTETSTNWASPVSRRRSLATSAPARALRCGVQPRLRHGDPHGAAVGVAVDRHRTAHRRQREVGGQVVGVRAGLAERGDGHVDDVRAHGAQRVEAQPEAVHHARAGVLEHEVDGGRQRQEVGATGRLVEVEHDAALAAVVRLEAQTGELVRLTVDDGRLVARRRAARRLDLDHVGTEAGQDERGQFGATVGQVEHPVGREHRRRGRA